MSVKKHQPRSSVAAWMRCRLSFSLLRSALLCLRVPPRLSTTDTIVRLREGQEGYVLECNKDVGDDPITYRWLKDHKIVTGVLGYAYRGFNKVFLALHTIELEHAGTYVCEASNTEGVHSAAIKVIVESRGRQTTVTQELQPHTDEILSEIATSLSDVLAEGECTCDTMFLLHVSTDAEEETVAAQANLVHIIADQIVSETNRVSVVTYSDYLDMKLSFGKGTNKCALRDAFKDLTHQKWTTRLEPVMREAFKKLRKSLSSCKVLFLPIFGSLGAEGADVLGAQHLKKLGVKIFILEVTPEPLEGVQEMASKRGDGYPYHWRVPLFMWRTIVINMNYIAKEVVGCMAEVKDFPKKCVAVDGACTNDTMCQGVGYGCEEGQCVYRECNINPRKPGCCNDASPVNGHWCGDVTSQCTSPNTICDGIVQCMNGADERRCWSTPCPQDKIARCQTSTLCLDLMDLCNGDPECPGGEDEDPRFCKSFPCPRDRPFRCRNGKCIAKESLCDGVFRDCDGGEDEAFEYCKSVHVCPASRSFKCDYGICISEKMVCDGTFNCLDATDELVCDRQNCPAERAFKCLSGLCISMDQVCNGVRDGCDDGSDEQNCTNISCPANRNFKCTDGICIDGRLRCNGRKDCDDNSDEQNCPTPEPPMAPLSPTSPCPHNMFKCNTGACISDSRVCDGRKNCPEGEDEEDCQERECPAGRPHRCSDASCVAATAPCDGTEDCPDGSDEYDCPPEEYDEYSDYEEYYYEADTERPPSTTTTTTTTTTESKPKQSIDVDMKKEEETQVEPEPNSEEEIFIEGLPRDTETVVEEPNDAVQEAEDMEAVETMLEPVEEPAASSEQGAGGGACVSPTCLLTLVPLFVFTCRNVWMR